MRPANAIDVRKVSRADPDKAGAIARGHRPRSVAMRHGAGSTASFSTESRTIHLPRERGAPGGRTGRRKPLVAARTLEYRSRAEQLPTDKDGQAMMEAIRVHFKRRPHAFEHCAAALARLVEFADIAGLDVTRPSRDGGTRPRRFSTARRPRRGSGSVRRCRRTERVSVRQQDEEFIR